MGRQALFTLMGVLSLLAAGTPAMTAPEDAWTPPIRMTWFRSGLQSARLAIGEDGTQVAVWQKFDSDQWALMARVRPPGEAWGPETNVSGWSQRPDSSDAQFPEYLWDIGVDADGSAVALWVAGDSTQTGDKVVVRFARRPPGGSWQVVDLTDGYETAVRDADLHFVPGGALAAVWVACTHAAWRDPGPCQVKVRRTPAGDQPWLPVERADDTSSGEGILAAYALVGPGGLTTVLWTQFDASTPANWAAMARTFSPAPAPGGWDASPVNLSGWRKVLVLSAPVTDPGGTVTAAWSTRYPDPAQGVYARTRPVATGAWDDTVLISTLYTSSTYGGPRWLELAAGRDGTVAAAWDDFSPRGLMANVRDAGSEWGEEAQVCLVDGFHFDYYGRHTLGVLPDGSAIVLCSLRISNNDDQHDELVHWSARSPQGAWGDSGQGNLTALVAQVRDVRLEVADDGSAVAAWRVAHTEADYPMWEDESLSAATWPPGGPFGDPVQLWWERGGNYTLEGLAVGRQGWPAAMLWLSPLGGANGGKELYYTQLLDLVYVPLSLYQTQ